MGVDTVQERSTPNRDTAVPDSYAIYVNDGGVDIWQYRVNLEEPGGAWRFVESHDPEDDLRVSLELATLTPPSESGYWVYSTTYDCETDCK